jgi:hypothetical protein
MCCIKCRINPVVHPNPIFSHIHAHEKKVYIYIYDHLKITVYEISSLRCNLQQNGYPWGFIDFVINSKGSSHLKREVKSLGSVYIPYMKGVSEKFKRIGNWYNIRTIFRMKTLLGAHSWEPGQKEIHNRQHSVSLAFPVNVSEDTLVKQVDH